MARDPADAGRARSNGAMIGVLIGAIIVGLLFVIKALT